ncbi:MAG TPA: GNAT family N-acetyltransferase [Azospira sp.]|nr:GNAT family N-acetyltransferase [Azospira sp.]
MGDWPSLRRIARQLFPELSDTDISHLLRHHHGGTVVACCGGEIVGYYQLQPHGEPGVAWLNYLGVLPAWRGHGIASALLQLGERHGSAGGFASLALDVLRDNQRALRFYRRHGYLPLADPRHAAGDKIRIAKPLTPLTASTPAPALPALTPAPRLTRVWRRLAYAALIRLPWR